MIRRTVLAAALVAPALALVSAAPASAGCAEDYAADVTSGNDYLFPSPSPTTWVTVSGLVVTIDGADIVNDTTRLALFPVGVALIEGTHAAGATTTFVDCVV